MKSLLLARTLPCFLLCACAPTAPLPTTDQPELAQMAQSYARQLEALGVTRVISPGNGAMVQLETGYGAVYVRYPTTVEPMAFVLDIGPESLRAAAATFDRARLEQILAALMPEAERVTSANNRMGWIRANPWH
jgi:hypothetical protein